MSTLIQAIAAAAIASLCASCATVTRGTTEQIQIVSDPPGAEARTSMGFVCTTPCTLQAGRKDEFTVTFSKPGYQPAEVTVTTKVNPGGGAAFAGNVLVGGLVGMAADASTGAGLDHYPNPVEAALVPMKSTRAAPPKSTRPKKNVPEG
jgi:hypothetical protein